MTMTIKKAVINRKEWKCSVIWCFYHLSSESKEMRHTSGTAACQVLCCGRVSLLSVPLAGKGSLCRRPCGGSWDTSILSRSKQTTGTLVLPESFWTSVLLERQVENKWWKWHLIFFLCVDRCLTWQLLHTCCGRFLTPCVSPWCHNHLFHLHK